jgi:hypothetical protein
VDAATLAALVAGGYADIAVSCYAAQCKLRNILTKAVAGSTANWAMLSHCCASILQVQLTGPSRGLHLSAADAAACAAAAGQWSTALQTLLAEYKRSIYFPECVLTC